MIDCDPNVFKIKNRNANYDNDEDEKYIYIPDQSESKISIQGKTSWIKRNQHLLKVNNPEFRIWFKFNWYVDGVYYKHARPVRVYLIKRH